MRSDMRSTAIRTISLFTLLSVAGATTAAAQSQGFEGFRREAARALSAKQAEESTTSAKSTKSRPSQPLITEYHFRSKADSLDWLRGRNLAERSSGFRIIVSLQDHHVWVVS